MAAQKEQKRHVTKSTKEEESDSLYECSICYNEATDPVVLMCGHFYCWKCIDDWLNNYGPKQCPICKITVQKKDVVPLYGKGKTGDGAKTRPAAPAQNRGREGEESNLESDSFGWAQGIAMVVALGAAALGGLLLGRHSARRGRSDSD